jgi:hypothetical protein
LLVPIQTKERAWCHYTVPQFQSSEAFRKRHKHRTFKNNTARKPVNLWKHSEKTDDICTFNEAVRDILHLREFQKQMDETVLKAYGWQDIDLAHDFYEVGKKFGDAL